MTRKRALLTGASLLLAMTVGFLLHSGAGNPPGVSRATPARSPQVPAEPAPAGNLAASATFEKDERAPTNESARVDTTHPLAVFRDAVTQHPAGVDPMIVFALENFSDEQIAAYNELHVIPFNPAVGKLCDQQPDPRFPGMDFDVERCETVRERPPHPYTQLSDADLQTLAETDPAAAVIMGMRVVGDDADRNRWYLRAAALSGKSGPIMALANRRYASVQSYKRHAEGRFERVDDVEKVRYRAVLETIAGRMRDPRANPAYWREQLIRQTGDAGSADTVDRESVEIMEQMARIQRDITGSTQMWELIHAA